VIIVSSVLIYCWNAKRCREGKLVPNHKTAKILATYPKNSLRTGSLKGAVICILSLLALSTFATSASALVLPLADPSLTTSCATMVPNHSVVNPETGKILLQNWTIVPISSMPCGPAAVLSVYANIAFGGATVATGNYFTYIDESWSVPSAPSSPMTNTTQLDALWNGFGGSGTQDVVQPALVYGCVSYNSNGCVTGSESGWSLVDQANVGNHVYDSSVLSASASDSIVGEVTYDSSLSFCSSSGPGYSIGVGDSNTGHSVTFSICDTYRFKIAYGQSLEVHYLTSCTQLPNQSSEDFTSLSYSTATSGTPTFSHGTNLSFCGPAAASWDAGDTGVTTTWTT